MMRQNANITGECWRTCFVFEPWHSNCYRHFAEIGTRISLARCSASGEKENSTLVVVDKNHRTS